MKFKIGDKVKVPFDGLMYEGIIVSKSDCPVDDWNIKLRSGKEIVYKDKVVHGIDKTLEKIKEKNMEGQTITDKTHKDYGTKYDEGKPMIGLITPDAIWKEAQVMTFGGKKYGLFNWAKGISVLRLLSAAMRHILQFNMGQDNDEETGIIHLAHARCCLAMAMWMVEHKPEFDDRFKETK